MGSGAALVRGGRERRQSVTGRTVAVILAAGRGTRMRAEHEVGPELEPAQRAAADRGLKSLVPFHGRTFLEWSFASIATAGVRDVVLVIGPETEAVRAHLTSVDTAVNVHFTVQTEPRGSAHALLSAESAVGDAPFLALNADNLYPAEDLRRLAELEGPGLIGYARKGLVAGGIPPERIAAFALIDENPGHELRDIVEKPDAAAVERLGAGARVSMTCWRFDEGIFAACRAISPSRRGELELPDAVRRQIAEGVRFRVLHSGQAVLDLSTRADIPIVAAALLR